MSKLKKEVEAALKRGDRKEVLRMLDAEADQLNARNDHGNTLLHLAVELGQLEMVKELLRKGADINATNHHFETPLELAFKRPAGRLFPVEIIPLLLQKRAPCRGGLIDNYAQTCCDKYEVGEEHRLGNQIRIAHYASRLIGENILKRFEDQHQAIIKYIAHLREINDLGPRYGAPKQELLEGWRPEHFLPLRIYGTFETLQKLMLKKAYLEGREALSDQVNLIGWPAEIPNNIEGVERLFEVCRTYLISELETLRVLQEMELIRGHAFSLRREELLEKLTLGVLERLARLTENAFMCLYMGYERHAIYLKIVKKPDGYEWTVHNLGEGYRENGHRVVRAVEAGKSVDRVCAFPLGKVPVRVLEDAIKSKTPFYTHLRELLKTTFNQEPRAVAVSKIYQRPPGCADLAVDLTTAEREQQGGHCVVRNHESVRFSLLGPSISQWLTSQELTFLHLRAAKDSEAVGHLSAWEQSTHSGYIHRRRVRVLETEGGSSEHKGGGGELTEAQLVLLKQDEMERLTGICSQINQLMPKGYAWAVMEAAEGLISFICVGTENETLKKMIGALQGEINKEEKVISIILANVEDAGDLLYLYCEHLRALEARVTTILAEKAAPGVEGGGGGRGGSTPSSVAVVGLFCPGARPRVLAPLAVTPM